MTERQRRVAFCLSEGNMHSMVHQKVGGTLGRLWRSYFEARSDLGECSGGTWEYHEAARYASKFRDRLVINYSPLVKYVVGLLPSRMRGAIDHEDVMSWGVIGLLKAVETFDPLRKTKFESYAISRIRWAILDEFRKQDWVPRRVRGKAHQIEKANARLSQELGRSPSEPELAAETRMSIAEYRRFVGYYSRSQISSLEARLEVDNRVGGEFHSLITDRAAADPQSEADRRSVKEQLAEAIGELEEQERLVATFYFYEGLTMKETGEALGLTESRISQILRHSLHKLRENLADSPFVVNW